MYSRIQPISIERLLRNPANARECESLKNEARRYEKLSAKTCPPILVRHSDEWILDGHHRAEAAILRGETTVVGVWSWSGKAPEAYLQKLLAAAQAKGSRLEQWEMAEVLRESLGETYPEFR